MAFWLDFAFIARNSFPGSLLSGLPVILSGSACGLFLNRPQTGIKPLLLHKYTRNTYCVHTKRISTYTYGISAIFAVVTRRIELIFQRFEIRPKLPLPLG